MKIGCGGIWLVIAVLRSGDRWISGACWPIPEFDLWPPHACINIWTCTTHTRVCTFVHIHIHDMFTHISFIRFLPGITLLVTVLSCVFQLSENYCGIIFNIFNSPDGAETPLPQREIKIQSTHLLEKSLSENPEDQGMGTLSLKTSFIRFFERTLLRSSVTERMASKLWLPSAHCNLQLKHMGCWKCPSAYRVVNSVIQPR